MTATPCSNPPIVCDMTDAPDTAVKRLAEYQTLFATSLIGRERTTEGIRFRFRAAPGLEDQVRDLATREQACCAFFTFTITVHDDEIWWDSSIVDDDIARQILDQMCQLPDTAGEGVDALFERFGDDGLTVVINDDGTMRPATREELGLAK
jgi:hypothetical protein